MSRLPASLLQDLAALQTTVGATVLLRHAQRGDLPAGVVGDDVPLTTAGRAQATALGSHLGLRLGAVRTSPVLRCCQTAQAILAGARRDAEAELDPLLGAPGPFVIDSAAAWPLFLQHGAQGLARLQLQEVVLSGLRPLRDACVMLLRSVLRRSTEPGRINLYVTHDIIIALLAAFLLGETAPDELWPDFLEGILLWPEGQSLVGCYRGRALRSAEP